MQNNMIEKPQLEISDFRKGEPFIYRCSACGQIFFPPKIGAQKKPWRNFWRPFINIARMSTAVPQRGEAPPQGGTDEMDSGPVNILLVEDNPDVVAADYLRDMLAGAGNREYHLECVDSIASVGASLVQQDVAAVLLDLSLPDSEGLETIRRAQDIAKGRLHRGPGAELMMRNWASRPSGRAPKTIWSRLK